MKLKVNTIHNISSKKKNFFANTIFLFLVRLIITVYQQWNPQFEDTSSDEYVNFSSILRSGIANVLNNLGNFDSQVVSIR